MIPTPHGDWREFRFTWDSGSDASADVTLVDLNTGWNGNDFAIDNMTLEEQMPTVTTNSTWGKIKDAYR
jgi:hypothetical protein